MSLFVIPATGLVSKACLRISGATVHGLENLQNALAEENRKGKGVLTLCNHISVVDEPFMWGCLPASQSFRLRNIRWTLGASDIMFTNPVLSAFFRAGQVIETFRGKGVYQHAVEDAITKLDEGRWVHLFPEGKVNQPSLNTTGGLFRFKWGIARMIMDAQTLPTILPIWLSHFDAIMPEPRSFPRFIPRLLRPRFLSPPVRPDITFGLPLELSPGVLERLEEYRNRRPHGSTLTPLGDLGTGTGGEGGVLQVRDEIPGGLMAERKDGQAVLQLRRDITAELQDAMVKLGREVAARKA